MRFRSFVENNDYHSKSRLLDQQIAQLKGQIQQTPSLVERKRLRIELAQLQQQRLALTEPPPDTGPSKAYQAMRQGVFPDIQPQDPVSDPEQSREYMGMRHNVFPERRPDQLRMLKMQIEKLGGPRKASLSARGRVLLRKLAQLQANG